VAEFRRLAPPIFGGSIDPQDAGKWLQEMEKAFKYLKGLGVDKTAHAVYMLKGRA